MSIFNEVVKLDTHWVNDVFGPAPLDAQPLWEILNLDSATRLDRLHNLLIGGPALVLEEHLLIEQYLLLDCTHSK